VDHFSRRVLGAAVFPKEPTASDLTRLLDRLCRTLGCRPAHLITDHGVQFTAEAFRRWCRRHRIRQRFGAIGKYGSLAVVERLIRSMKTECTRLVLVPFVRAAFQREVDLYVAWFNAERPHSRFGARTPDEIYFGGMPVCRKPRFEPRARGPRRSPCARPQALVRGRPGIRLDLDVRYHAGRKHLPIVEVRRAA
jgi:putative transposase